MTPRTEEIMKITGLARDTVERVLTAATYVPYIVPDLGQTKNLDAGERLNVEAHVNTDNDKFVQLSQKRYDELIAAEKQYKTEMTLPIMGVGTGKGNKFIRGEIDVLKDIDEKLTRLTKLEGEKRYCIDTSKDLWVRGTPEALDAIRTLYDRLGRLIGFFKPIIHAIDPL